MTPFDPAPSGQAPETTVKPKAVAVPQMTRLEKLEHLLAFFEKLPSYQTNLNVVIYNEHNTKQEEIGLECGTVGCVAGWACMVPEFRVMGLGARIIHQTDGGALWSPTLNGSAALGWDATVAKFFDIPTHEAEALFSGSSAPRSQHHEVAIRRLKRYIARERAGTVPHRA